jgi:hypothetical protein
MWPTFTVGGAGIAVVILIQVMRGMCRPLTVDR